MTDIRVSLKTTAYDVKINDRLHARIGQEVAAVWSRRKVALLTDSNVGPLYLSDTKTQLEKAGFDVLTLQVAAGEQSKTLAAVGEVIAKMAAAGFTRGDGLIALGGGVIGDLGGVVASLYMRGIAFIQIATSLTAQVDSSVGGKTAVNLADIKNIAGSFYQPDLDLIDSFYLATLSDRDLVEGYAEVVKMSALDDQDFFDFTGNIHSVNEIRKNAEELSARSIAYKARIVMADEKEAGQRQFLNFGHTLGHAIELLSQGHLRHGEAVAIGMIAISRCFEHIGTTPAGVTDALLSRLNAVALPTRSDLIGTKDFFRHLINDKKNHAGILNLVALADIGQPEIMKKSIRDMPDFLGALQ